VNERERSLLKGGHEALSACLVPTKPPSLPSGLMNSVSISEFTYQGERGWGQDWVMGSSVVMSGGHCGGKQTREWKRDLAFAYASCHGGFSMQHEAIWEQHHCN